MADIVSAEVRSRMMSGIRGKHTEPELFIRRSLYRLGYRYRLHCKGLPGKPDIVFASRRALILVHGCFWHGHGCQLFRWPSSRPEFWKEKISGNKANDQKALSELAANGWRILTIWECALKGRGRLPESRLVETVTKWLEKGNANMELEGVI